MPKGLHVCSEIGKLRKVMLHRPGEELLNLSPDNLMPLLFDDIPYLRVAQEEHDTFARMLREQGVEVLYLEDLVAEALEAHPEARPEFTDRWIAECHASGRHVIDAVRERLDSIEDTREFVQKTFVGIRADELDLTPAQAGSLADLVSIGDGTSGSLVVDPIPNTYFTRDSFSIIRSGVSINRMYTSTRRRAPPRDALWRLRVPLPPRVRGHPALVRPVEPLPCGRRRHPGPQCLHHRGGHERAHGGRGDRPPGP